MQSRRQFLGVVTGSPLAAAGLAVPGARARGRLPRFFGEPRPSAYMASALGGPDAVFVEVDANVLPGPFSFLVRGEEHRGDRPHQESRGETTIFRFYVAGSDRLSTLSCRKGRVAGYIETAEGSYAIRPEQGGLHCLSLEIDALVDCRMDKGARFASEAAESRGKRPAVRRPPSIGYELVVAPTGFWYHKDIETLLGGPEDARLVFESHLDAYNTILQESGDTCVKLSLAMLRQLGADDARGTVQPDYDDLENVIELRRMFAGDEAVRRARFEQRLAFAVVFHGETTGGAATGYFGNIIRDSGTCAVSYLSAVRRTLAHELGHCQGLDHNKEDAVFAENPCSYVFGYRSCPDGIKDVMSAGGPCVFETMPWYSNPRHLVRGKPFGSFQESDGVRRVRETRHDALRFWELAMEE